MGKNSFTIFETLLSISILTLIISGFINSTYYEDNKFSNYQNLNNLENSFKIKNYNDLTLSNKNITITTNYTNVKNLNVKVHSYEDKNMKIFKYEK